MNTGKTVRVTYDGYHPEFDDRLEKAVGKQGDAGFGFGERDLVWDFKTQPEASVAAKKLRRFSKHSIQVSQE